ncbi:MAG: RloB family protein [Thiohalomonadales bacterium]
MGSDNLFHRRKAKQGKDLARKKAMRASYAKILIVCEGEKTEPNYFNELKDYLTLNSATVKVTGECESSPISVFEYSLRLYKFAKNAGDSYDKVFCVFDKDTHSSYQKTLQNIESVKPKDSFAAITSTPCFEYWLMLHFTYTTRQFRGTGNSSSCDQLITELKNYFPRYQKGDVSIFDKTKNYLPQAKSRAARSLQEATNNMDDNPSTKVHLLIEYLENLSIEKA